MDLSIIVPVYNLEGYLTECLESLVELNIKAYEIIIVNDGSRDQSKTIINDYVNRYSYIKCIDQSNCGLSVARNRGVNEASGRFIAFIDGDDYINRDAFIRFVKAVLNDNVDVAIGTLEKNINGIIKKEHRPILQEKLLMKSGVITGLEYIDKSFDYVRNNLRTEAVTQIYKKSFLEKNSITFQPQLLHEDTLFTIQTYLNAKAVKYYAYTFYVYRMRVGSIMHEIKKKNYDSIWYIVQKLYEEKENRKIRSVAYDSLLVNLIYEANKNETSIDNIDKANLILKRVNGITIKAIIKKNLLKLNW